MTAFDSTSIQPLSVHTTAAERSLPHDLLQVLEEQPDVALALEDTDFSVKCCEILGVDPQELSAFPTDSVRALLVMTSSPFSNAAERHAAYLSIERIDEQFSLPATVSTTVKGYLLRRLEEICSSERRWKRAGAEEVKEVERVLRIISRREEIRPDADTSPDSPLQILLWPRFPEAQRLSLSASDLENLSEHFPLHSARLTGVEYVLEQNRTGGKSSFSLEDLYPLAHQNDISPERFGNLLLAVIGGNLSGASSAREVAHWVATALDKRDAQYLTSFQDTLLQRIDAALGDGVILDSDERRRLFLLSPLLVARVKSLPSETSDSLVGPLHTTSRIVCRLTYFLNSRNEMVRRAGLAVVQAVNDIPQHYFESSDMMAVAKNIMFTSPRGFYTSLSFLLGRSATSSLQ